MAALLGVVYLCLFEITGGLILGRLCGFGDH